MHVRTRILCFSLMCWIPFLMNAQEDSIMVVSGILYDASFFPIPATHVVNVQTHRGVVTDSLGIFSIPADKLDTLLIRNIAFRDTLVPAQTISDAGYVVLRRRVYELPEARIFEWGATYEDFREAIIGMPSVQTLGESMGFPTQDPDYIPFEMNEALLKSVGFLIQSPISYFYYNFSKQARSARKLFWMEKNREKQSIFDEITSPENLTGITGLTGEALQHFRSFLFERIQCNINCTELQIYSEVYKLWEVYQVLYDE